ncbi:GAF domain-containing protein [Oculatella sp. LEGE 06141]|uniref:ATP-binding protein n=1 Tax=Oculatella sp. LEGE 06141 TaxID=1828648 RepID=UPI0018824AA7|nr:ATP-binding protein [Oculatella sp. LEGE 06141]MBE9181501.1 GAF domain-containing protein [Oculatella sp. LEGE 06141]
MVNEVSPSPCHSASKELPIRQSWLPIIHNLEHRLTDIMLTSDSTQLALKRLTETLEQSLHADRCTIAIKAFSPESVPVSYCRFRDIISGESLQCSEVLHHPAFQDWMSNAHPIAIADLQAWSPVVERPSTAAGSPQGSQPRAVLVTRTLFQGQVNGVIILTRSCPDGWTELEVQLLKAVSKQVAIAISQAQLEQQVQQQIQYQTLVDQLTRAIRNDWNLDQVFQLAVEGSVSALQVSRGLVLLMKYTDPLHKNRASERVPGGRAIVVCEFPSACERPAVRLASPVYPDEIHEETGTWISQSFSLADCRICQSIFTNGIEPIAIPAPGHEFAQLSSDDSDSDTGVAPIFNPETMPSTLLVPLENQGTILGCLVLQHTHARFWNAEEVAFIQLVAAQLSTAIIQNRTLRQVQALVDERTAQLRRSLDVQAKLYEKTRQQIGQLRRLNAIHEEFLSTMSHELLTPLTSMTLAIRMLRQAALSPERQAKYLDILEQQCLQETSLINDLLALQRLETSNSSVQLQKIDLKFLVRDLVESFTERFTDSGLTLEVDLPTRLLPLYTDVDSLNRILVELLTNARKYAAPGSLVQLKISQEVEQSVSQVVMTVTNNGSGITPEELPYIFEKFRRGRGVTQRAIQGTGLGLALVKGLAEHLNGAIVASSQPSNGSEVWETCFTLTLPQFPEGFIPTSA